MLVAATADGIAGYMLPFGWNLREPAGTVPAQGDLVVALGPLAALDGMAA